MQYTLRKYCLEDAPTLAKYANNYNVAKYLTDQFPYPYTLEDGKNYILSLQDQDPALVMAIDIDGEVVGAVGIFPQTDIHRKNAEMGYWLAEPFWGKGIMTSAVQQMVEYGFNHFDIDRIYARPFGQNKGSQRVLEKAGFTLEAQFKNVLYKNGEYTDELVYAVRKLK